MPDQPPQDPFEMFRRLWGPLGVPLPGMAMPTLDPQEIEKRIAELKLVEGWLTMNLNTLRMAIQGLEMQKTGLEGMNAAMQQAMQSRLGGAVPELRPQDMADIVAFLYASRYFKQAGDPRKGVILATNKGCLSCHGLYGERGKVAGDLTAATTIDTPAGVLSALWNHTFIADPRAERDRTPWSTFRGEEMADLVAYLRSLKRGG